MKPVIIPILTFALIIVSCTNLKEEAKSQEPISHQMLLTSSSKFENSEKVNISGFEFTIVMNESSDTSHWSTIDNRFKTPEGFGVGTTWKEIPEELKIKLEEMPGWAYYIELDSKWKLAFCEGASCTELKPRNESTVNWIFKKNN